VPTTTSDWLGNHVQLQPIDDTDLTLVQWCRPRHGTWRGSHVLDADELRQVRAIVEQLDGARQDATDHGEHESGRYLLRDLAGSPLHLESLLSDLLER
jgi:hypothetical protein